MAEQEPLAPWSSERDERSEGVALVYRDEDIKQTVRRTVGGWMAVDWELQDFDGERVWAESASFTLDQALIDAVQKLPPCEHKWIDATNEVVSGTDLCLECGAVRAQV